MDAIPLPALAGQILIGLINGAFYAMLSLGLAIIFGLLNLINFTHGVQYMMGAFVAWMLLNWAGVGYWWALLLAPVAVALLGMAMERLLLRHVYDADHAYGLLLTYGIALVIEGLFLAQFGSSGLSYPSPIEGGTRLSFAFVPHYRAWVVVASLCACLAIWLLIERTRLGSYLRAASERPALARALGINVPRIVTLTYGLGVGLAALGGVLAAPIYGVTPTMGSSIVIVVFAVVVIGGMGSIPGAIIAGFTLGVVEGLTKVFYPQAANTVIFLLMIIVLMIRPGGLLGEES
ncbi:MAG TPA: branched-chain amino acid ABC transporter permease [Burkholderiaceae bacterium]|nr:branched-chain amino acid ABC transporter permease [Burkholderiaceae bacterium]